MSHTHKRERAKIAPARSPLGAAPTRPEIANMHPDPVADALKLIHAEQVAQRDRVGRMQEQLTRIERQLIKLEVQLTLTSKVYPDEHG